MTPKNILNDETLYFTDNGAVYHGKCCGASARFTGRDISGQRVEAVTEADIKVWADDGFLLTCEQCVPLSERKLS